MKTCMIFIALLLSACAMFRATDHITVDSSIQLDTISQWKLKQQYNNSEVRLKDGIEKYELLIESNAPFKWQADSGLSGGAGVYQLYLQRKWKSLTQKHQTLAQQSAGKVTEHKKQAQKSIETKKKITAPNFKAWLFLIIGFVLLSGFCLWRWKRG